MLCGNGLPVQRGSRMDNARVRLTPDPTGFDEIDADATGADLIDADALNGRYSTDRLYADASARHQTLPPHSASVARTPAIAMAKRPRQRRRASGSTPGGSPLSRTAVPTIVSSPAVRKIPSAASTPPSHGGIGRSAVASASTGTTTAPFPAGPSIATASWYDEA